MGRRKAYDALWHPPRGRRKNRPVNPKMHPESLEKGGEEILIENKLYSLDTRHVNQETSFW